MIPDNFSRVSGSGCSSKSQRPQIASADAHALQTYSLPQNCPVMMLLNKSGI